MALRLKFDTRSNFGRALELEFQKATKDVTEAAVAALDDVAKIAVRDGRANIRSAGKFTGAWVTGLTHRVYRNDGLNAAALIYHRIAVAGIFEEGGLIIGSPLLWLPIGRVQGSVKQVARRTKLVSARNRKGKRPLLLGRGISGKMVPMFVGVSVAHIRKRFNIAGIVKSAAGRLAEFYLKRFRART